LYTIHRVGTDSFFAIEQFPAVQGLDHLISNCVSGAYEILPPLSTPCKTVQLETLPWGDLRDGHTNNLHRAVTNGCFSKVYQMVKEEGYSIEAMNLDRYWRAFL
jgi:hypothetical protein